MSRDEMNIFTLPPGLCELAFARTCPAYICRRSLSNVANLTSGNYAPPTLYPHKQQRNVLKLRKAELPKTRPFDLPSKMIALEKATSDAVEKLPVQDVCRRDLSCSRLRPSRVRFSILHRSPRRILHLYTRTF